MTQQPLASVIEATGANFDEILRSTATPIVVDFWAPWCVWCRKLAPLYDQLAATYGSQLKFVKVNVETERALAERFGVSSLPTLKYFCNGREIGEQIGAPPRDRLEGGFQDVIDRHKECLATSSAVNR